MTRDWKTDGWKYKGQRGKVFETRHDAIGNAAIMARIDRENRHGPIAPDGTYCGPTVEEATSWVYAFKPFICGYCKETFLTESELGEHKPCPYWEKDRPQPSESGSNPIEAARMTRYGL